MMQPWWSHLPAVRRFALAYRELPTTACLELGCYDDGSVRLNVLGASSLPLTLHRPHLSPSLFDIARDAALHSVPFHLGLCIRPPSEISAEVYLVTMRPLAPWLYRFAQPDTPELAMLGVSEAAVKRYLLEKPSPSFFELPTENHIGRIVAQLCQVTGAGCVKRYLDIRPFPEALVRWVRTRVPWSGRDEDLRYGVVARSSSTWGFYAPLSEPHEMRTQ